MKRTVATLALVVVLALLASPPSSTHVDSEVSAAHAIDFASAPIVPSLELVADAEPIAYAVAIRIAHLETFVERDELTVAKRMRTSSSGDASLWSGGYDVLRMPELAAT